MSLGWLNFTYWRPIVERAGSNTQWRVDFTAETLANVQALTLIIQGDSDWCFPPPLVAEMQQAIPDAALWVIPNGEHVPILGSRAPRFLEIALAFYRGESLE